MAALPDPFRPQRRIADVLSHVARVLRDAPWELDPEQRIAVKLGPRANTIRVAVYDCDDALMRSALRSMPSEGFRVSPAALPPWLQFEHDGLTVVFHRR